MKQKARIIILILLLLILYNFFRLKNYEYTIFLLDTSYSMNTNENGSTRFEKAKNFILNSNTSKISIYTFGNNVVQVFPTSENKKILEDILNNIKLGTISAGEDILKSIFSTLQFIENMEGKKNLIVLTDGGKNNLNFGILEKDLIQNNIYLTVVAIGSNAKSNLELTDSSGQSRQVKDKGQIVSSGINPSLKSVKNIKNSNYIDIKNNRNNLNYSYIIIIIILILLYLGTYLKLK